MISTRLFLVPAGLCELVLVKRWFRHLEVYLFLKHNCCGQTTINNEAISELAYDLALSPKTIRRSIEFLKERKWIGFNVRSGITCIRGFDSIRVIEKINSRKAYWFNITLIKSIKAFVIAVCYSEIIRRLRWAEGQKRGRPKQKAHLIFYPVPLNYFAEVYNCAKSTSSMYRRLAKEQHFIEVREDLRPISPEEYMCILELKEDDETKRIIRRGDRIYQQYSDRIQTNLLAKRRRSIFKTKSEP